MTKVPFLSLLLFVAPAFSQTPPKSAAFEVIPSCIWSASKAHCVVQNRLSESIVCKTTVNTILKNGRTLVKNRQVFVQPKMYSTVIVRGTDIDEVTSYAECSLGV